MRARIRRTTFHSLQIQYVVLGVSRTEIRIIQILAGLSICLAAAVNGNLIGGSAPVSDLMFGYVFVYVTGNGEGQESIFLAASKGNDALFWTELNEGQPILKSTKGTRGVRDPFLIRAAEGDKFYLIATDLHVAGNWLG
ncbi:hypothetical protein FOYG_02185 [Fusarium oxysporum NRRL 32931]|uniref:Uncharacterized protein n=1 Tax=Fusarium oxysporum NRRL 32931 TaxID=660029 RepID=W9IRM1_FUSOX|nr:hypothetical protein FOYG_02185 [Fusarium oxysporum NRRL 32931]